MRTFRDQVEDFLRAHPEVRPYVLGQEALRDPSFVRDLRAGRQPQERTMIAVRNWMRAHKSAQSRKATATAGAELAARA